MLMLAHGGKYCQLHPRLQLYLWNKAQLPLIKLQKAQKVLLEILNYCHVGYPLIDVGVRLITADRKCITENAKMPRNAASFRK